MDETLLTFILAITAYFLGSISFSYIITKKVAGKDIRNIDIKNAGAYNVALNVGKKYGIIVGILDALKTLVIVLVGSLIGLSPINTIIAASLGIVGHCFPIFHNFYGGKGAASAIGIFAYYIPFELLISLIPAVIIALTIHKLGTTPIFIIGFSPIISIITKRPASIILALTYIALLTGILNAIIIIAKREKKVMAER
ncbi:MAG: glycerol-3-phosphate acyltransferase [Candidatus Cloacimonadota bacterium]|nr:glycerol-3-phosphate acyltransferase [Candidatus Cloacimonadota bacterium]